jgi:hypothetical protein
MSETVSDLEKHAQRCKRCADALFDGLGEHPFCPEGQLIFDTEREDAQLEEGDDSDEHHAQG